MGVKENLNTLYSDTHEYAERSIDNCKLTLVKYLSLLFGDMACYFVVFMLLFLALIFMLVAMVVLLAPVTGFFIALAMAVVLLAAIALGVFLFRERLFVNIAVKRLCRMLFENECEDE